MKKGWIGVIAAVLVLVLSFGAFADAGIEIVRQPTDITASIGETGTATVEATSEGDIQYQWYYRTVNSSVWEASGMTGADTDTIRVEVLQRRLGQEYKCVLTDEAGESVETEIVRVVNADRSEIVIVTPPEDIRAKLGENGAATVAAESEAELSYQWYFKTVGTDEWKPSGFEGCKTATITVPVTKARIGQQYKCVITTEDGGRVETEPVSVLGPEPSKIVIVTPPEDVRAKIGETGAATVAAESEAELSYQWYFKTVGTDEWKPSGFEGCKTATITVPVTKARIGQQYKCVITTEDGGRVETEPVSVLEPEPSRIVIVTPPEDIRAKIGETGAATVEAESEAALSYEWYFKTVGTDVWRPSGFEGCKTNTVTVPVTAARIGQQYKCVITTADGGRMETEPVSVLEPPKTVITIVKQPEDVRANVGSSGTATVQAESDALLSYQWYFKSVGSDMWQASGFEGCKTDTITVPVLAYRIGQQYKCVITAPDGTKVETKVITVREAPTLELSVTRNPDSYIVLKGQPIQLDVSAKAEALDGGSGEYDLEYQWYRDGEPVEGANESELVILSVKSEDAGSYYCLVTADGETASSRIGTVEVITLETPDEADDSAELMELNEAEDSAVLAGGEIAE